MKLLLVKRWLLFIAGAHILGGLVLPLVAQTNLINDYLAHLQTKFPNSDPESLRFFIGVFGPTVASWGLLFFYAINNTFKHRTTKEWWLLVSAILIWGLLDSFYSAYFGIDAHLYLNGLVMLLTLIPLILIRPLLIEKN